jgi:hypothetical protein
MTELEKIGTLIDHWQEHNNEHAELYMDWAEKTSTLGRQELSKILIKLALESKRLNRFFQAAKKVESN